MPTSIGAPMSAPPTRSSAPAGSPRWPARSLEARAEARAKHGWIMDTYLLPPRQRPLSRGGGLLQRTGGRRTGRRLAHGGAVGGGGLDGGDERRVGGAQDGEFRRARRRPAGRRRNRRPGGKSAKVSAGGTSSSPAARVRPAGRRAASGSGRAISERRRRLALPRPIGLPSNMADSGYSRATRAAPRATRSSGSGPAADQRRVEAESIRPAAIGSCGMRADPPTSSTSSTSALADAPCAASAERAAVGHGRRRSAPVRCRSSPRKTRRVIGTDASHRGGQQRSFQRGGGHPTWASSRSCGSRPPAGSARRMRASRSGRRGAARGSAAGA